MNRLFEEKYEQYNDIGEMVANDIRKAIRPILSNCSDRGISINDFYAIVVMETTDLCVNERLNRMMKVKIQKVKLPIETTNTLEEFDKAMEGTNEGR